MKKSAIERRWAYSKRGHSLLLIWKFLQRCVASDNSWFWVYKKQATVVLILVDWVKFKADSIRYESYYHSVRTTFIIEINSYPCKSISQKITSIKVCEMRTVSRPERSECDTFWTTDKKQFNLDY